MSSYCEEVHTDQQQPSERFCPHQRCPWGTLNPAQVEQHTLYPAVCWQCRGSTQTPHLGMWGHLPGYLLTGASICSMSGAAGGTEKLGSVPSAGGVCTQGIFHSYRGA